LIIFAGCEYPGCFIAVTTFYQYKQSAWFSYLGKQDSEQFHKTSQALFALLFSSPVIHSDLAALPKNMASLDEIRGKSPRSCGQFLICGTNLPSQFVLAAGATPNQPNVGVGRTRQSH